MENKIPDRHEVVVTDISDMDTATPSPLVEPPPTTKHHTGVGEDILRAGPMSEFLKSLQ
jgi:hypothetical protein